jgi:Xaa-Pro aminopeptidase
MNQVPPTSSISQELETLLASLPASQDDPRVQALAKERRSQLRLWMAGRGFDAVLLSRRDHFAWLTAGGDNRVLNSTELGFGHLLLTQEKQYLLAHTMDALRLFEEQAPGQGYELLPLRWYEGDPRVKALELAHGRVAGDTYLPGIEEVSEELGWLHFPLASLEITRLRWLARQTETIVEEMAMEVLPGMREAEIAAQMQARFALASIDLDVLIIGSDERIFKYRHPLPTGKTVDRYLLLHPAARRWGLHANITRSLHFGPPPAAVAGAYSAVATVEGRLLSILRPGLKFAEILACQKSWYADLGMPEEWRGHFQGGPTGYIVVDAGRCLGATALVQNQSFDWFITATGAKVEELSLLSEKGMEILSYRGGWPGREIHTPQGTWTVPDLFVR